MGDHLNTPGWRSAMRQRAGPGANWTCHSFSILVSDAARSGACTQQLVRQLFWPSWAWLQPLFKPRSSPVQARGERLVSSAAVGEQAERRKNIAPILETLKGSTKCAQAYEAGAVKMHVLKDRPDSVAVANLRERVVLHEAKGAAALLHGVRAGKGQARVTVSREP